MDQTRLTNVLQTFCEESTLHGVQYMAPSRCKLSKLVWSCVLIICFTIAILVSMTLFTNWAENPIVTTIDSTTYPVQSIPFPAVTICPNGYNPWGFVDRYSISKFTYVYQCFFCNSNNKNQFIKVLNAVKVTSKLAK
jgi:hypothetical protein